MLKTMVKSGKAGSPADVARAGKRQVLTGNGRNIAAVISRLVSQSRIPCLFKNT